MKTSLTEMSVIEDFTPVMAVIEDLPPGKGAYSILHSKKGRLLKTTLPERAVIEDFTPGKGGY